MKRAALVLLAGLLSFPTPAQEPRYDLVIRQGRVLDPSAGVDAVLDVAISGDRIARVAPTIQAAEARQVIEAEGLLVTPGLVDLHVHVFHGTSISVECRCWTNRASFFPISSRLASGECSSTWVTAPGASSFTRRCRR